MLFSYQSKLFSKLRHLIAATPQTVEETEQKPTENAVAEEEPQQPEPEPLGEQPEGVMPIFLPKSTKEIYKIVEGENVTEEKPTIFVRICRMSFLFVQQTYGLLALT